jgi:hypothetical protein
MPKTIIGRPLEGLPDEALDKSYRLRNLKERSREKKDPTSLRGHQFFVVT